MGKMTDALRRAKELKEQREGRAAASAAPASAPVENVVAPPKPAAKPVPPAPVAAPKPAAPRIEPVKAAPPAPRVEPPKPAPAPLLPKIEPPKPEPIREPVAAKAPEPEPFGIVEDEPGEAVDVEVPELESLPIIEEPAVEPPPVPVKSKPEVVKAPPMRAPEPEPVAPTHLVFETVEEAKPAPAPVIAPAPTPKIERAPEPVIAPVPKPKIEPAPEPIAAKAPVAKPKPVAPPVEPKPVVVKPEPPAAVIAPPPKVEKPAPAPVVQRPEAPAPVLAPKVEPKPAPKPEPRPAVAWIAEPEPVKAPVVAAAPAPALPEVEPTPKPSRVPYLSVHYGRDERMTDEFRRLKTRLNEEGPARLILIVSPRANEGKTTVALNLASSFANAFGEKVVVVDGNVSRPKIGEVLEAGAESPGLVRAVRGRVSADEAAVETAVGGLYAVTVPAGRDERVEGLLDSDGMRSLLASLRKRFTRVIVELPAAEDHPEGLSLAAQADVVLVPVMRTRSRRKSVRRLVETLKDRGASRVRCVFIEA